jgi:hypothetical protein
MFSNNFMFSGDGDALILRWPGLAPQKQAFAVSRIFIGRDPLRRRSRLLVRRLAVMRGSTSSMSSGLKSDKRLAPIP